MAYSYSSVLFLHGCVWVVCILGDDWTSIGYVVAVVMTRSSGGAVGTSFHYSWEGIVCTQQKTGVAEFGQEIVQDSG